MQVWLVLARRGILQIGRVLEGRLGDVSKQKRVTINGRAELSVDRALDDVLRFLRMGVIVLWARVLHVVEVRAFLEAVRTRIEDGLGLGARR